MRRAFALFMPAALSPNRSYQAQCRSEQTETGAKLEQRPVAKGLRPKAGPEPREKKAGIRAIAKEGRCDSSPARQQILQMSHADDTDDRDACRPQQLRKVERRQ